MHLLPDQTCRLPRGSPLRDKNPISDGISCKATVSLTGRTGNVGASCRIRETGWGTGTIGETCELVQHFHRAGHLRERIIPRPNGFRRISNFSYVSPNFLRPEIVAMSFRNLKTTQGIPVDEVSEIGNSGRKVKIIQVKYERREGGAGYLILALS